MEKQNSPFKKTDIGFIPVDWDVESFSDAYCIFAGGDFDATRSSKLKSEKYFIPIYSNSISRKGLYGYCNYAVYKKDCITITARGTLGVAMWRDHPFTAIGRVLILKKKKQLDNVFVTEYINSEINFVTETTGVPQLTAPQIAKYQFPVPRFDEQQAIATVLSDVDGFIESLEQLIAKKRDMKTATMQQLLTGRKRLPGFMVSKDYIQTDIGVIPEDWDVRTISSLCEIVSGGTPSTANPSFWFKGNIPWCTPSDITNVSGKYLYKTDRNITSLGLSKSSANLLPEGSLLLCSRATIGEVKITKVRIATNQGFKSLLCHSVDNEFMYYKVLTLKDKLLQFSIGSTFLEFSKKDIARLQVDIPKSLEQKAIATVLSDMDAEIDALEQRLKKARSLKTGMMQELLTGKTRLIKVNKNQETV